MLWDNHYVEASHDAYDTLIEMGYVDNEDVEDFLTKDNVILLCNGNELQHVKLKSDTITNGNYKRLYHVKNKFVEEIPKALTIEVGKTYWYCHTSILTEYPKQVTVENITGDIIFCDDYIGQYKYGQLSEVCKGLFLTEEEVNEWFITLSRDGNIHLIDTKDDKYMKIYNYFVKKKPSVLI